jgi:hypothetical protein
MAALFSEFSEMPIRPNQMGMTMRTSYDKYLAASPRDKTASFVRMDGQLELRDKLDKLSILEHVESRVVSS